MEDNSSSQQAKCANQGGDTENIGLKSKIEFAQRMWNRKNTKILSTQDVETAIKQHFKKEDCKTPFLYI